MKDSKKNTSPLFLIERYIKVLVVIWTIIVAASLTWSIVRIKKETLEGARIQAHISYVKDILYRRWNAIHGGVYVPVTEETQPNPYLTEIPERDITTPSGRRLTLINPAFVLCAVTLNLAALLALRAVREYGARADEGLVKCGLRWIFGIEFRNLDERSSY